MYIMNKIEPSTIFWDTNKQFVFSSLNNPFRPTCWSLSEIHVLIKLRALPFIPQGSYLLIN